MDQDQREYQTQEADRRLIFVIPSVLRPRESAGGGIGGLGRSPKSREKQRDGLGVGVKRASVLSAKFAFFPAHDEAINE